MSMLKSGQFVCDRCGTDVGNGGIQLATSVTFLDDEAGSPVVLNYCRDRIENDKEVKGCEKIVLSAGNTAYYLAHKGDIV